MCNKMYGFIKKSENLKNDNVTYNLKIYIYF